MDRLWQSSWEERHPTYRNKIYWGDRIRYLFPIFFSLISGEKLFLLVPNDFLGTMALDLMRCKNWRPTVGWV